MNLFVFFTLTFSLKMMEVEAGFRCNSLFKAIVNDGACSASCVILGQSSGVCDDDKECHCSEKSIDLEAFREILPTRCDLKIFSPELGLKFCQGTCQAIGRSTGFCYDDARGCECSSDRLTPSEFALCAAESTCRLDCQRRGKASGECQGWNCVCTSNI